MGFEDKQKAWRRLMKDIFRRGEKFPSILDVPCGRGELYSISKRRCKRYFGIDTDPANVRSARVRTWGSKIIVADPLNISYPASHFTVVISWGLIPSVKPEQLESALREIIRVSGKYVLFNWYSIVKEDEKTPEKDVEPVAHVDGTLYLRGRFLWHLVNQICPTIKEVGIWQYGTVESAGEFQFYRWVNLYRKW